MVNVHKHALNAQHAQISAVSIKKLSNAAVLVVVLADA